MPNNQQKANNDRSQITIFTLLLVFGIASLGVSNANTVSAAAIFNNETII